MLSSDYREEFEDGKLLLYVRNGIFYARVYVGGRKYLHKSLKTSKLTSARKLAQKYFYEIEFRQAENLPLQQRTFNDVIDEYVAMRERDYERSKNIPNTLSNQQHTTIYMLRQIKRVVKFWREYCGKMSIDRVGDAVLRDYVDWRKDYYRKMKPEEIPRNAKIDPKDKTLEWEVTLAKTLIRYAHERGYRGNAELPQWRYKAKQKIVRPAFTVSEYAHIYRSFRQWIREVDVRKSEARYMRETLRDYVHILASSGVRVGELNSLRVRDVEPFTDKQGRKNYFLNVNGKTGKRVVVPRVQAAKNIDMVLRRVSLLKHYNGKVRKSPRKVDNKNDWLFRMFNGNKVITLIDQFLAYLKRVGITQNGQGERYTLYSLRHFYAVRMLSKDIPVFDVARNMGTSVQIIESYYGKSATAATKATRLGD